MSHQLYQQMILDHSRSPKGFCDSPQGLCESAYNPLCGDKVKLCITVKDGLVENIQFNGEGCSLSMASASILIDVIKGKSLEEIRELQKAFLDLLQGKTVTLPDKLNVFSNVVNYPMRVKCVTMVWHALMNSIDKYPILLSDSCLSYWEKLVSTQGGKGILIEFKQLGCYGWQFVPSVQKEEPKDKLSYDYGKLMLWMDESIQDKVRGTQVDCIQDDFLHTQVVFKHPSAKQHCGCGESFVIEENNE